MEAIIHPSMRKDTKTEEGMAEGSGTYDQGTNPGQVLVFAPSYDNSKDYGDYKTIKKEIITRIKHDSGYEESGVIETLSLMNWMGAYKEEDAEDAAFTMDAVVDMQLRMMLSNKHVIEIFNMILEEYCTQEMAMMILCHPEFNERIKNNPIELLKTIEEAMPMPAINQVNFDIMTSTINQWMVNKKTDEDDVDYIERHKTYTATMRSIMGSKFWNKIEALTDHSTMEFEPDNRDRLMMIGFEIWKACLWCRNFDNMASGHLGKFLAENHAWSYEEFLQAFDMTENSVGDEEAEYDEMVEDFEEVNGDEFFPCLLYTSPSPRDLSTSRMPSSA